VIELVALDMAGTTVDEHGDVYVALREAVEAEGVEVADDDLRRWMGTDKRAAIAALVVAGGGPDLDRDGVEQGYERFRTLLAERYATRPPVPIAGVPEALASLRARGIRVALTTGFAGDVAGPLLASLGWEVGGGLIDAMVCSDDVPASRPAPYLVFRAMERTGVEAVDRVLVAGDTLADLRSGTNAGARLVVGVASGALSLAELGVERHTHLLASVAELPALLDGLDGLAGLG
jgi:phosphonatase-like hydrolase